jgi:hypothetical protein
MKRTLLLSLILAVCLGACEYNRYDCDIQPDPETEGSGELFGRRLDCSGTVCTANFADIRAEVVDASGAAVTLDSFVVTNNAGVPVRSAQGIPLYGNPENGSGSYTILNDAWVKGHEGLGGFFYAKGFRGGRMVFDEIYKISADCCHVSKISGKDRIIVP